MQPISCFLTQKMGLKWPYRCLRVTQMADFDFLGNYKASSLKIEHVIALDSLYMLTGNDVTNYFRSEANRTNV